MKVIMNVSTHYKGAKLKGKEYDIDSVTAQRWEVNGIASIIEETKEKEVVNDDLDNIDEVEDIEDNENETDYAKMSAKKLYTLCKEKELDVKAKQSKEYYIEKLQELE